MDKILDFLLKIVERDYGISPDALTGSNKNGTLSRYRFIIIRILRLRGYSEKEIGRAFNGRDESTICNAHQKAEDYIEVDKSYRVVYEHLMKCLEERIITQKIELPEGVVKNQIHNIIITIELVP